MLRKKGQDKLPLQEWRKGNILSLNWGMLFKNEGIIIIIFNKRGALRINTVLTGILRTFLELLIQKCIQSQVIIQPRKLVLC